MRLSVPVRTPVLLQKLLPGLHFTVPTKEQVVYATFDDGPLPEFCPWILDCLREHKAKASFFLVGENAKSNPELVRQILDEGHSIGNHTRNHLNGFKTSGREYLENVRQCHESLRPYLKPDQAPLFRPPYGKIRPAQIRALRQEGFEIIMWDVLSKDYDADESPEKVFLNVVENVRPGSILVFHDNKKAEKHLRFALPKILKRLTQQGYRFEPLNFPAV